jgi:hypothetical protein
MAIIGRSLTNSRVPAAARPQKSAMLVGSGRRRPGTDPSGPPVREFRRTRP